MVKQIKTSKKIIGVALAGALVLGTIGGMVIPQTPTVVTEYINTTVEVPTEVVKEVIVNNTIVEIETVEDTESIALTCDRLLYEDIEECVEEVKAEDAALRLALEEIEANYADELEDADLIKDEDKVEVVKMYTDFEDIEVVESNFKRDEYEFIIKGKFEDTKKDRKVYANFEVEVEDGEAKISKVKKD